MSPSQANAAKVAELARVAVLSIQQDIVRFDDLDDELDEQAASPYVSSAEGFEQERHIDVFVQQQHRNKIEPSTWR